VVKKIFEWRAAGMSYQQIARTLNELAIPSPSRYLYMTGIAKTEKYAKTVWNISNVKTLLRNGVYCGDMVQGRRRSALSEGIKDKYLPKEEWAVVPNTHEALIDADTFAIVQRMAEERKTAYHERIGKFEYLGSTPNILRGLIFCADCKRPLVRYKSVTNKGTNRYYVWICQSHSNNPAACPKKYLHETELIGVLWDILRREIALASEMEATVRRYSKSQAAQRREQELEREEADARQALDRANMFYESLYASYVAELLTEQEYSEMKLQYRGEIAGAKERLEAIAQQRKDLEAQTVGNPWMRSFSRFREAAELTADMAHALIERVEVNAENGIEVKLRYRNEYRELLLAVTEAVPA
ncbi:MAG: recombinase family protein, partial [Oscillospiraceae bacterium]|nr:recombinase family protein [Oscillospiraceae bacterium]